MIEKKEIIIEKMKERGYSKLLETRNNNDLINISFIFETDEKQNKSLFPIPSYTVTVWVNDEEFQFCYGIPSSINKLVSPKCGSFMNDEHFDRLAMKFEKEASIIQRYCR